MNQISDEMNTGAMGELLVQIRLLQFGVQAACALKDSGNDLIAVRGTSFRAIQVRTSTQFGIDKPEKKTLYHLLAVVHLDGDDRDIALDKSSVYLVPKGEVAKLRKATLDHYKLSKELVDGLFAGP